MPDALAKLEARREEILSRIAQLGDMRKGSITKAFRPCGKPTCACSGRDHPGHGPYYAFTRKVGGKTSTVQLRPGDRPDRFQREVETYKRFRALSEKLVAVSDVICEMRPDPGQRSAPARRKRLSGLLM